MEKMTVSCVIEILGKPKEHVADSLKALIDKIASEKGMLLKEKKLHEPIQVKESTLFTSFAELTIELDSAFNLFGLVFGYLPSNIEVISPEKFSFSNQDLTEIATRISQRLHEYDGLTKHALADRNLFLQKLKEVAPDVAQSLFKKT